MYTKYKYLSITWDRISVKALRAVIDLTSPDHPHLGPSSLLMGAGVPFQLSPGLSVTCHNTTTGVPVSSQSPDICWMDAFALLCRELSSCKNSQPYAGTLSPAWPWPWPHFFLLPGCTLALVHCLPCFHGYQWTLLAAPGSAPHIQPLWDCAPLKRAHSLWSDPQFIVPCLPALAALWQ